MRTVKFEMHKPDGTFGDLLELHGWLLRLKVTAHKFNINVSITEKEKEKEYEDD